MKYSFTIETDPAEVIEDASRHVKTRRELADALGCESRGLRQFASSIMLELALADAALVEEFSSELLDALNRPEPRTRYQVLRTLDELLPKDARLVEQAYEEIETCLYDDESPNVRVSAFHLLTHYGTTTPKRSERVWPSLAEALRCWHRDRDFNAMIDELQPLLEGKCSPRVLTEAKELFAFDCESTDPLLKRRARQICDL